LDVDDLIASGLQPGQRLLEAVQARIDRFAETYDKRSPSAVRCLLADRKQLTSYLRCRSSTTAGSGTPTSSRAPSAKLAAGPR
jgi:hypothetical protein